MPTYQVHALNLNGSHSHKLTTTCESVEAVKVEYVKQHPECVALWVEPATESQTMREHKKWVDSQAGIGYFRKHGNLTLSDTSEQYARREDSGRY